MLEQILSKLNSIRRRKILDPHKVQKNQKKERKLCKIESFFPSLRTHSKMEKKIWNSNFEPGFFLLLFNTHSNESNNFFNEILKYSAEIYNRKVNIFNFSPIRKTCCFYNLCECGTHMKLLFCAIILGGKLCCLLFESFCDDYTNFDAVVFIVKSVLLRKSIKIDFS